MCENAIARLAGRDWPCAVGLAAGSGTKLRDRLAAGEARVAHYIEFHGGRVIEAELVGKNTGFLFYLTPGDTEIGIVPLADNVQRVQRNSKAQQAEASSGAAEGSRAAAPPG